MTEQPYGDKLSALIKGHRNVVGNPPREAMIQDIVDRREAVPSANGALSTWTPPESTGRSPSDTYAVRHPETAHEIDPPHKGRSNKPCHHGKENEDHSQNLDEVSCP